MFLFEGKKIASRWKSRGKSETESVLSEYELTKRSTDQNVEQWKTIDWKKHRENTRNCYAFVKKFYSKID